MERGPYFKMRARARAHLVRQSQLIEADRLSNNDQLKLSMSASGYMSLLFLHEAHAKSNAVRVGCIPCINAAAIPRSICTCACAGKATPLNKQSKPMKLFLDSAHTFLLEDLDDLQHFQLTEYGSVF